MSEGVYSMNSPEEKPLTLSATWFQAVAPSAAEDNNLVELRMGTIGLGPHFDAKEVFTRKERHLVHSFKDEDGCNITVAVKKDKLARLAQTLRDEYNFDVLTFGRDRRKIVSYQNGAATPCTTPYEAMMMAFDHS